MHMHSSKSPAPPLLVLSNGHGEDLIAARVLAALRQQGDNGLMDGMALVGLGAGLASVPGFRPIGPRQQLPSGGFSNQSFTGLLQDLWAGLGGLTLAQWRTIWQWRGAHPQGVVLAVGDLLPLVLAWDSGLPYGFIGTPKSDWTWLTNWGTTPVADAYHRCKGSEWDPWEWWLMGHGRCRFVVVRDGLTARGLRRHGIDALAPGNPMVDGPVAEDPPLPASLRQQRRWLMLPGSRLPECLINLERLLAALPRQPAALVLLATGHQLDLQALATVVTGQGFAPCQSPADMGRRPAWRRDNLLLLWGPGCFETWLPWAELGLATAGTATEQLVGRGVPALSLPGPGPQFTPAFARRQSRLLGGAVIPCFSPQQFRQELARLLEDDQHGRVLGRRGRRRMGPRGGSGAIARLVRQRLLQPHGTINPAAPLSWPSPSKAHMR